MPDDYTVIKDALEELADEIGTSTAVHLSGDALAALARLVSRTEAMEEALREIVDIATPKTFIIKPGEDVNTVVWAPVRNIKHIAAAALASAANSAAED